MSGLTNFLTPYSHLIFANRDKVIVLLALVLGWTVIQLLVARWRTERLERDLVTARASVSTSPARSQRQISAAIAEEAPAESGALPPVKGGRSYARNLGSALQKAGIPPAGPQLYSPPVPTGWNPNTGTGQPGPMQQPMQPPTYAPQPAPWGAPPAPPSAPWAYPAGANRSPFAPQPASSAPYAPPPPQSPSAFAPNQGQPMPMGYPRPPSRNHSRWSAMLRRPAARPWTPRPSRPRRRPSTPHLRQSRPRSRRQRKPGVVASQSAAASACPSWTTSRRSFSPSRLSPRRVAPGPCRR